MLTPVEFFICRQMRQTLTIFLCLFLVHCSKDSSPEHVRLLDEIPEHIQEVENLTIHPGDSQPLYSIEIIKEQVFGTTEEAYLTRISRAVVDDNDRVIVWNFNTNVVSFPPRNELYVYNPDGTYLTQIGGTGKGPGEFGMLMSVYASAGKVFALDHTSQRLNVYNGEDFSFERSTLIEQWSVQSHEVVRNLGFARLDTRNDGNHLVVFGKWRPASGKVPDQVYLLMDTDGNALNFEPMQFPASFTIRPQTIPPSPTMELSFMGRTITALSGKNALYTAWTQDFLIKKYDADGVYQSAIYYPVKGSPFDLSDYTGTSRYSVRDIRNAFENSDKELPETNPVLADLIVDDENRIWAAVPADSQREMLEWWILSPSGELLAKLQRPRDKKIFDIKNGYLYGKEKDEKTGAEFVVKYRIELKERE